MYKKITKWNEYYKTRKSIFSTFAQSVQYSYIKKYLKEIVGDEIDRVIECGGGNSCIFERLAADFNVKQYKAVDNSQVGVSKFLEKVPETKCKIKAECKDLLCDKEVDNYDLVLSLGLIEHFEPQNTRKVIIKHFDYTERGYIMITFPTPTKQYRFIRRCMEILGLWQFWDERPLTCEEVESVLKDYGKIEVCVLMRRMPLTQMLYIVKKREKKV